MNILNLSIITANIIYYTTSQMHMFHLVQKEVEGILLQSPLDFELQHSQLTLKWVIELKSDADEALQIAAISHDMERWITHITERDLKDLSKYNEFKKEHCIRSANLISDILKKYNYSQEIIRKVFHLVENHEFGWDEDGNVLMDADSLAYFEYNLPTGIKRNGVERAKEKMKFMYTRLSSNKAKELVNHMCFDDPHISQLVKEAISEI